MIAFFRKIRQKLFSEKKFSTYMLYAIGEIVLPDYFITSVNPNTKTNLFPSWEGSKGVGTIMRKIILYNPDLVPLSKKLRKNMTLGEIALWREIKGKKLGFQFSRQIPIDHYIVDFYCKDLKLAIEVDGSIHFKQGHPERDEKRQRRLESLGIKVIRFSDADVKNNLGQVLDDIQDEINRLVPTPNPSQEGKSKRS